MWIGERRKVSVDKHREFDLYEDFGERSVERTDGGVSTVRGGGGPMKPCERRSKNHMTSLETEASPFGVGAWGK